MRVAQRGATVLQHLLFRLLRALNLARARDCKRKPDYSSKRVHWVASVPFEQK